MTDETPDVVINEGFITEFVTTECDSIAREAKVGTDHEQHDGWRFPSERPARLYCGCGAVLVEATGGEA